MCEIMTPSEEITMTNNDEQYKCLQCIAFDADQPEEDRCKLFSVKIATLIDEEEKLNANLIESKIKCDNFQAKYRSIIGAHEKALNDALESIKVIRQAYHGNVMVGNHCVIVLKKFWVLTAVIEDASVRDKFNEIFTILADIMALVMACRFLSTDEINHLENLCKLWGKVSAFFTGEKYQ